MGWCTSTSGNWTGERSVPKTDLTTRQKAIFDFVVQYWADNGWGPNVKDVQRNFGFRSYTAAKDHLFAIARKGYIEYSPTAIYPSGLMPAIKEVVREFHVNQ